MRIDAVGGSGRDDTPLRDRLAGQNQRLLFRAHSHSVFQSTHCFSQIETLPDLVRRDMVYIATMRVILKIRQEFINYSTLEKCDNYLIVNRIICDFLSRSRACERQVHGGMGDLARPFITCARDRHVEHFVLASR
jgi:hypothetical protein